MAEYKGRSEIRPLSPADEVFRVLHEWIVSQKFKSGVIVRATHMASSCEY